MQAESELQAENRAGIDPPAAKDSSPGVPTSRGRRRAFFIFFSVLLVIAAVGFLYWWHSRQFESTDDAQIDAHLNPISSRVDGTITRVYTDDNRTVKAGDLLVELDGRDYQAALDQSLAQLAQARSMLVAQQPNVPITQVESTTSISTAEADVANAQAAVAAAEHDRDSAAARLAESEANNTKAQADLTRYQSLIASDEISRQEYDQIVAAARAQAATVAASQANLESAARTVDQKRAQLQLAQSRLAQFRRNAPAQVAIQRATVASNRANTQSAEAQADLARLKLSYCKILAPVAGIITRRSAEVGSHISAGQQLMQIVQIADLWVTANFKETQLRDIRPQQSATIHVDALKQDFEGYVEALGGATGAITSVLPPENATGNFVKVVQRIPVRIRFKPNQAGLDRLRPGMSVEPAVRVRG